MNAKTLTNTKIALILHRFHLGSFKPIWKAKADIVCKHTQRIRIMWQRIHEQEATLPLFDEDYKFDDPLELFRPVDDIKESKAITIKRPTQIKREYRPTIDELKAAFWAEELKHNRRYNG